MGEELHFESTVLLKIQCLKIEIPSTKTGSCTRRGHRTKLVNFFKACRSRDWRRKISPFASSSIFRQTVDEREEISLSVSSPGDVQPSFPANFIKKLNLSSFIDLCKEWIKHPMNIALLIWFICVASSSSMQALLLLGMLNKEFPGKSSQNRWIEINNQVLNALFTLMSLYQHPSLLHHLVLLCRWKPEDIIEIRKIYCKNGAHKPNEWAHIMVILVLLHITCFSQYVLCGLYWGYTITTRPEFLENFFNAIGFIAPTVAAAYAMYSPLGKESSSDSNDSETVKLKLTNQRASVTEPEWNGGVFDCRNDISVSFLSFFCCFCIFGWNMERLGFGNMYVHIAMFFLLCFAPLWIFGISALNISNGWMRNVVAISGMVLSVCGLIYGGFWRLKMRKRFKLGGNRFCCGSEAATDYLQWLFCCWCSLAQEVRTGNFYEVEDGGFYRKDLGVGGEDDFSLLLCPLPRESKESSENASVSLRSWNSVTDAKRPPLQQLVEVM
ncbi:uncharacterized protein LOC110108608 [Dendrobium catenatum]|uniref:Uncharacterized protein n=1 Tax=Dendrobium catenatum TaxID=906689 RepID=A0A2I0X1C4_9ASPA|nr:uncharacterized protein LOC110108608 [Dendrobium catenatum]XP_020695073.1 uncharacterized protein LOC110108608 [Dendrobium catenatum]PKU81701.1 hypothetical protein MA16_Dca023894 [Dendrobium catenatum]